MADLTKKESKQMENDNIKIIKPTPKNKQINIVKPTTQNKKPNEQTESNTSKEENTSKAEQQEVNNEQTGSLLDIAASEVSKDKELKEQRKKESKAKLMKMKKPAIILGAAILVLIVGIVGFNAINTTNNKKDITSTGDNSEDTQNQSDQLVRLKEDAEKNGYNLAENSIEFEVKQLTVPANIVNDGKKQEFKDAYTAARNEGKTPYEAYASAYKAILNKEVKPDSNTRYNPDSSELPIEGSNGGASSSEEGKGKASIN